MRLLRALLVLGVLGFVVAGCGGGGGGSASSVGGEDVATVGSIHVTRTRFDELIDQAKRQYKQQGRTFPKAGSQEYASLKARAVSVLVRGAEWEVRAKQMGITVSDKDVDARLQQIKKQYFQGSDTRYQQQLKKQNLTDAQVRADIKSQLISEKVFKQVTNGVTVSNDEIHAYYLQHSANYAKPQSREVRHILVKTKPLADKIYAELKGGADFAKLAKKYSQDPGSKDTGGKLTVTRGQTVAQFDATAFSLKTKELSKPVKTQYGWHVIQALSNVHPRAVTPEKQVRDSIKVTLLQQKKNEAMQAWVTDTDKKLKSTVKYAAGYKPPATTASATTTG